MTTEEWLKEVAKEEGYVSLAKLIIAKSDTLEIKDLLESYIDNDDSGLVEDAALSILVSMGHKEPYVHDEDEVYQRWKDDQLTEVEQ